MARGQREDRRTGQTVAEGASADRLRAEHSLPQQAAQQAQERKDHTQDQLARPLQRDAPTRYTGRRYPIQQKHDAVDEIEVTPAKVVFRECSPCFDEDTQQSQEPDIFQDVAPLGHSSITDTKCEYIESLPLGASAGMFAPADDGSEHQNEYQDTAELFHDAMVAANSTDDKQEGQRNPPSAKAFATVESSKRLRPSLTPALGTDKENSAPKRQCNDTLGDSTSPGRAAPSHGDSEQDDSDGSGSQNLFESSQLTCSPQLAKTGKRNNGVGAFRKKPRSRFAGSS
eukprot:SAG31_NODE_1770_length_7309_cov_56.975867_5_plen_285_part_00